LIKNRGSRLPEPCCGWVGCALYSEFEIGRFELGITGETGWWRGYGEAAWTGETGDMYIKPLLVVPVSGGALRFPFLGLITPLKNGVY